MQRRRSLDDLQRSYAASLRLRQVTEWTSRSRRLLAGKSSANPDLDPTEDTGGLVPVTSLLVGDQDKRLLSEAANASTRPADLIEIVKRAPIGR